MYNNIIEAEYLKDYVRPVTEEDKKATDLFTFKTRSI